jgi:hypothetical protein
MGVPAFAKATAGLAVAQSAEAEGPMGSRGWGPASNQVMLTERP